MQGGGRGSIHCDQIHLEMEAWCGAAVGDGPKLLGARIIAGRVYAHWHSTYVACSGGRTGKLVRVAARVGAKYGAEFLWSAGLVEDKEMDDLTELLDHKVKALNYRPPPFAATAPRPAQLLAGHPMFAGVPDAEFHSQVRALAIHSTLQVCLCLRPLWQETLAKIIDTC